MGCRDCWSSSRFPVGTAQANVDGIVLYCRERHVCDTADRGVQKFTCKRKTRLIAVAYIEESYGFDLTCEDEKQIGHL